MIYVVQILRMLNNEQLDLFGGLFEDLDFELEELGYKDCPEDLMNDLLDNHLGISIEDSMQLELFTKCILNGSYKSAIKIERLKRSAA